MTNTKVTTGLKAATHNYIRDKLPQRIYTTANMGLYLLKKYGEIVKHGGPDSIYPYIAAKLETNDYDPMYDGAIPTIVAPTDTDTLDAMHQEGWGYWYHYEAISHATQVQNSGSWASAEAVIPLAKHKEDMMMAAIGANFDYNIISGDGATDNEIIGFIKLFDITNSNYLGHDFTAETTLRPKNVTIATSYTTITEADLFNAYGETEEGGQNVDCLLMHPDILKRVRSLGENTVQRTQGGNVTFGAGMFDVLGAKFYTSRRMPTTTSTKIYGFNFGNHLGVGITESDKFKVDQGKYWVLELAGPDANGMKLIGWTDLTSVGYPGVLNRGAFGAFKLACTKPEAQFYISIA